MMLLICHELKKLKEVRWKNEKSEANRRGFIFNSLIGIDGYNRLPGMRVSAVPVLKGEEDDERRKN